MKSILEQMEEGRRLRRFESIESGRRKENEKEDLRGRLANIRQIIQGKPEKEARIILERFVEVEEIVDELIYFIDHDTSLYPRGSGPKIRQDLIEKGGAIPFFKANREFLGLFVIDGHGWLLQEIVKLYDLLSIDAAPKQNDAPPPVRALSDKIHWKADPDTLRAHLAGLRNAGYITFDDIEAVLDGTEIPRTAKEPEDRTILYIFAVWWELGCIDKSFFSSDGRDTKVFRYDDFIKGSFTHRSGNPFNNLSKAARPDKERKGFVRKGDTLEPLDKELHSALSSILK